MNQSMDKPLINPLWALRVMPGLCLVLSLVAMLVHQPEVHSACIGGTAGLLLGYCVFLTSVEGVVMKDNPQPSDVKRYPLA